MRLCVCCLGWLSSCCGNTCESKRDICAKEPSNPEISCPILSYGECRDLGALKTSMHLYSHVRQLYSCQDCKMPQSVIFSQSMLGMDNPVFYLYIKNIFEKNLH